MSAGVEVTRSDVWVYERLKAGVTGVGENPNKRIYPDEAPPEADHPVVVYQLQSPSEDTRGIGGERYLTKPLYLVKAVMEIGTYQGPLADLADEIEAALHKAPGGAAGSDGQVVGCLRERVFRLKDADGFRHLGGFYRVWVQV